MTKKIIGCILLHLTGFIIALVIRFKFHPSFNDWDTLLIFIPAIPLFGCLYLLTKIFAKYKIVKILVGFYVCALLISFIGIIVMLLTRSLF